MSDENQESCEDAGWDSDFSIAEGFLKVLDGAREDHIFVTVPERKGCELKAKTFTGTLSEHWRELTERNKEGCAVFVAVNEFENNIRSNIQCNNIRAFFVELDSGQISDEEAIGFFMTLGITFLVNSSPGNYHLYWSTNIQDADALEEHIRKYSLLQKILQYRFRAYESGKESSDLARILRLPGFFHQKIYGQKHFVGYSHFQEHPQVLDNARFDRRYTSANEILIAAGVTPAIIEQAKEFGAATQISAYELYLQNEAVKDGQYVGCESGGRNEALFNYCLFELFIRRGLGLEEATMLTHYANSKNEPPLPDENVFTIVQSAQKRFLEVHGGKSFVDQKEVVEKLVKKVNADEVESNRPISATPRDGEIDEFFSFDYTYPEMNPPNSQASIAHRIVQKWGNFVRYNSERGFYVKEDGVWINDGRVSGLITQLIFNITKQLSFEEQFRSCFVKDNMIFSISSMRSAIGNFHHDKGLKGIKGCLENMPYIYEASRNFESAEDADLLGCKNMILDLSSGEPATQERLLKSRLVNRCNVTYNREATCKEWEQFLYSCMDGNEEEVEYIQKICGYLISGQTFLQSFFMVYGAPGTGKSKFLNVMMKLMGDYAMELSPGILTSDTGNNGALSSLAQAQYKRLCVLMETERKNKWNRAMVKALAGEDEISCKLMRQNAFTFRPRFKMCIRGNELPHPDSFDDAIWQRLKFIPFNVRFRGTENEDTELETKLMKELSGILNWCIEGYRKLMADDELRIPSTITRIAQEAVIETEPITEFIVTCMTPSEGYLSSITDIHKSYTAWAREEGHRQFKKNDIISHFKGLGYTVSAAPEGYKARTQYVLGWQIKKEHRIGIQGKSIREMI